MADIQSKTFKYCFISMLVCFILAIIALLIGVFINPDSFITYLIPCVIANIGIAIWVNTLIITYSRKEEDDE